MSNHGLGDPGLQFKWRASGPQHDGVLVPLEETQSTRLVLDQRDQLVRRPEIGPAWIEEWRPTDQTWHRLS